jgi:uncharacterized HAD superfamily protein
VRALLVTYCVPHEERASHGSGSTTVGAIATYMQTRRRTTTLPDWESAAWSAHNAREARVIGVDCDGVLASDRLLWQRLRRHFPEHIPAHYEDLLTFEWPRVTEETQALCQELSADRDFIVQLAPISRMANALRWLHNNGIDIHVITARPESVLGATRRWLRMQGVSECVEEIHCVADGPSKIPLARELDCLAFVEDNHSTAEAVGRAGIRSYLLDAPYNRMPNLVSHRVNGWRELLQDFAENLSVGSMAARESGKLENSSHMPVVDADPTYSQDILEGYGLDRIGVAVRKRRSVR